MSDRGDCKDMETKRLFPDALYILRGFATIQVELGACRSGKASESTLRSASTTSKEISRDAHSKCPISNRMYHDSDTLKFDNTRMGKEDESTCLLIGFASVTDAVLDDWF